MEAWKPDGMWCICYDYCGLNAITRPAAFRALISAQRDAGVLLLHEARSAPAPATSSCGCCWPIGGRQALARSWGSSSGTWFRCFSRILLAADACDDSTYEPDTHSGPGLYGQFDVLVVDHDAKFTSEECWAREEQLGSSLTVGSASRYHKNTNAEWANGVIGDTL